MKKYKSDLWTDTYLEARNFVLFLKERNVQFYMGSLNDPNGMVIAWVVNYDGEATLKKEFEEKKERLGL